MLGQRRDETFKVNRLPNAVCAECGGVIITGAIDYNGRMLCDRCAQAADVIFVTRPATAEMAALPKLFCMDCGDSVERGRAVLSERKLYCHRCWEKKKEAKNA
jgi:formylmethanofuran dehydrogenase subunit E